MQKLADRQCHNWKLMQDSDTKILPVKAQNQIPSSPEANSLTTAAWGGAMSTPPDADKGQPLPSLYPKGILPSWCLSSHSASHDENL